MDRELVFEYLGYVVILGGAHAAYKLGVFDDLLEYTTSDTTVYSPPPYRGNWQATIDFPDTSVTRYRTEPEEPDCSMGLEYLAGDGPHFDDAAVASCIDELLPRSEVYVQELQDTGDTGISFNTDFTYSLD
jgi:hypothetical protein